MSVVLAPLAPCPTTARSPPGFGRVDHAPRGALRGLSAGDGPVKPSTMGFRRWSERARRGRRPARCRGRPWAVSSADGHRSRDLAASLNISSTALGSSDGRTRLDDAVGQRSLPDVRAAVGAHDRQRPALGLAEPAERDVGVLGGEVGAAQAPGPGEPVGLLQGVGHARRPCRCRRAACPSRSPGRGGRGRGRAPVWAISTMSPS